MSKRAKLIQILRTPKPDNEGEYIEWLEMRVDALTRLRLLDLSNSVNQSIANQDRYRNHITGVSEKYESMISDREKQIDASKPVPRKRTNDGYVYVLKVIGHDDLYKIGRTKNPDNRLATFNVKLPFPVEYEHLIHCDDMYQLEINLHRYFANKRVKGEFFELGFEEIQYIKGVKSANDVQVKYPDVNWSGIDHTPAS